MKKVTVFLAVIVVLSLFSVPNAAAGPALEKILSRGELIVGTTGAQPPLNAKNKDGKIIGLDADIARLIALNMGVKVKFETMPFGDLLAAIKSGKVDVVLSGMTMTLERNLKIAFVGPYYVSGKGILTGGENIATLQDAGGLNKPEMTIGALANSTSEQFVSKAIPKAKLTPTKSYDEAIDLLLEGKIDALIADYPFCAFSAFQYSDKGLIAGKARFTFEPLGIAVPEDTLLINWMQNFMAILEGSGQLKSLGTHWFDGEVWKKELP